MKSEEEKQRLYYSDITVGVASDEQHPCQLMARAILENFRIPQIAFAQFDIATKTGYVNLDNHFQKLTIHITEQPQGDKHNYQVDINRYNEYDTLINTDTYQGEKLSDSLHAIILPKVKP